MTNYPLLKETEFLTFSQLHTFNLDQVERQFNHFLAIKENRLKLFYSEVFGTGPIQLSSQKLQSSYYFFKDNIATRPRTSREINSEREKLPEHLKNIHKTQEYEFIEPTYSITFDLAIFFGELLKSALPELFWFAEKDKHLVNYGYQGVKRDESKFACYPRWILGTCAIQIHENRFSENRLVELFETWKGYLVEKAQKDFLARNY